jgi:hypothetical protein
MSNPEQPTDLNEFRKRRRIPTTEEVQAKIIENSFVYVDLEAEIHYLEIKEEPDDIPA